MKEMGYFVTSFVEIARCVSEGQLVCDARTPIRELFTEDFDAFDFETTLCCFEATHRVTFSDQIWESDPEDYYHLSIEEFIEKFTGRAEQMAPLFVTQRFLMFKESLLHVLQLENEASFEE